jgi:hypothetical protein
VEDGVLRWRVPLGEGAVPHVSLEDCGYYVRWLFDHPERANGMDLEVAVDHIAYADLAAAFQKVTGHRAQYIDTDLDSYWTTSALSALAGQPAGYNADPHDKSTMKIRDNFTGFWNLWKYGVVKRDYSLLDEIHPNRIKSAEEWFKREDQRGRKLGNGSLWERVQAENRVPILKIGEDLRTGKL